jgi:hypothetical protein
MFRLPVTARLEAWRKLRRSIDSLTVDSAVEVVAEHWHLAPFKPYYLDIDDHESWPDPWTLIEENYYCDLAKALGMLYTLYLSDHKHSIEYELRRYTEPETGLMYNLVWLNQGKYVLNLFDSKIVNNTSIDKNLKLLRCWSNELNLQKY